MRKCIRRKTTGVLLLALVIVMIGGMLSSTLLDQFVTPALFFKFGRKVYETTSDEEDEEMTSPSEPLHLAEQFRSNQPPASGKHGSPNREYPFRKARLLPALERR